MTTYAPGALVRARHREWVVLPDSTDELLVVRPLGGTDDETTGLLSGLETVEPATFPWPDARQAGDHRSARLLRDALRLGTRSSAGPFRSFGSINVDPRPYQLVPLLMALRLDPVRLLIADSVGIGKTVESLLIAKELLETGTATRFSVLCPPHLAEQWQNELADKFHINAELVLAGTAPRLERRYCGPSESLFEVLPYTVVSTDFIKSDRRRDEFLRSAPELVIVDEAHTCAADPDRRGKKHQRHELLAHLAADGDRHLLLVTATPHSGDEGAFRSLIGLLNPRFSDLPDDDRLDDNLRRSLARHLVQRTRDDVAGIIEDTAFPKRFELPEEAGRYRFTPGYAELMRKAIAWAKQSAADTRGGQHRQRVRFWAALALLRSISSSPAAAIAAIESRTGTGATEDVDEADDTGRRTVLDTDQDDEAAQLDVTPGADTDEEDEALADAEALEQRHRRRLNELAKLANELKGEKNDAKLAHTAALAEKLYADGFNSIIFCRFVDTAHYVTEHLRERFKGRAEVAAVTGELVPEERENRVAELGAQPRRILVATDCLSEGVNLQAWFDAVLHYDLVWNPTRLEQREGRVDRFGQASPEVRVGTVYGEDNRVDQAIRNVLLRKHRDIRNRLGVSISLPVESANVMVSVWEAIFDEPRQLELDFDANPAVQRTIDALHADWEAVARREQRSRTRYAQHAISTDEVAAELTAVRAAVGSSTDVARFVRDAISAAGGHTSGDGSEPEGPPAVLSLADTTPALRDALGGDTSLGRDLTVTARFTLPVGDNETYLTRTHPIVEGLAAHVLDTALDQEAEPLAARAGGIRTSGVTTLTTLLVVRYRFDVSIRTRRGVRSTLAEDTAVLAFTGPPNDATWHDPSAVSALLEAEPTGNLPAEQRERFLDAVLSRRGAIEAALTAAADTRAGELENTHNRVRQEAGATGRATVTPHTPVDVLGVYVLVPA